MERNELYPVFLKTTRLNILVVGGGNVAEEKLHFLFKSSPESRVEVVATSFREELLRLVEKHRCIPFLKKYETSDLDGKHIVIAATDDKTLNQRIHNEARSRNLLVNVADTPELCDFYLGGIVTKGHVKLAISTNGKSPVLAKRLRQLFERILPEHMNDLVENLHQYRKSLVGTFEEKVNRLNKVTKDFIVG
ncbi:MAG: bifunctional precorrin-2 dehydrogenase/sirohydrochlorin ferrochelatase [Cyclobacteriaceae bacterium]|nr:bifunctional precorrin-2 dehydrogenase/sirohydrochlorin ferrochelatase [Cyclobacteriaceae bacterium]